MRLKLTPPKLTKAQLIAKAASGTRGCVQARRDLVRVVADELRKAVQS